MVRTGRESVTGSGWSAAISISTGAAALAVRVAGAPAAGRTATMRAVGRVRPDAARVDGAGASVAVDRGASVAAATTGAGLLAKMHFERRMSASWIAPLLDRSKEKRTPLIASAGDKPKSSKGTRTVIRIGCSSVKLSESLRPTGPRKAR